MDNIHVLIVDDHTLVRDGLIRLLSGEPDIEVVAETGSGEEAVELCKITKPDVVLLDYGLQDIDGQEVTRRILTLNLGIRILILTMYGNEEYATRLIQTGASGFVVKAASTDDLLSAIRKVHRGGMFVSSEVRDQMANQIGSPTQTLSDSLLSEREKEVLLCLARGQDMGVISEHLHLSPSKVETYRTQILQKLKLRSNSDITRFAIRSNLIDMI